MNAPSKSLASFKPAALILAGVIAGSLCSEMLRPASALAQDSKSLPPDRILNSAEWTKQMSTSMAQANERLGRIEALMTTGLKVKVIEMPPVPKEK